MRVRVGARATVRVRVRVAEGSRAGWAIGHRHLLHLGGVVVGESAQRELVPHLHHATRKGTWRRVVVGVGAAGYEACAAVNAGVVYMSISGFGSFLARLRHF